MKDVEYFKNEDELYAIPLRNDYHKDGISFFTDDYLSQQLAYMSHPKEGYRTSHSQKYRASGILYSRGSID